MNGYPGKGKVIIRMGVGDNEGVLDGGIVLMGVFEGVGAKVEVLVGVGFAVGIGVGVEVGMGVGRGGT